MKSMTLSSSTTIIDISIIIVSRNVCDLLQTCLQSIFNTSKDLSLEVFVVDNASTDNTVEMVSVNFPQVKLVVNTTNKGFPQANNQVIQCCSGRYILLLNPDTIVFPNTMQKMIAYMDTHPEVGILGPQIISANGSIQYDCARNFPDLWGCFTEISFLRRIFPKSRWFGHQYMSYWDHLDSREVPCLVGAAMLVRRVSAEHIGWFLDDTIPMYFEDIDYCYRIHQAGWTVFYLSEAVIKHLGGQSTEREPHRAKYELLKWEAYKLFFERYKSKGHVRLLKILVLIFSLLRIFFIGMAIPFSVFFPKRYKRYFSFFTFRKAIILVRWSLNDPSYKLILRSLE